MTEANNASGTLGLPRRQQSLLRFVLQYWQPHLGLILAAVSLMLAATLISVCIPLSAKEIATYDGSASQGTKTDSQAMVVGLNNLTEKIGELSEQLFGQVTGLLLDLVRSYRIHVMTTETVNTEQEEEEQFLQGLLCRCLLMAGLVVFYHTVSLLGHLTAYRAGMASQSSLIESCLAQILSTPHPERIAVVDPTRLTHIVLTSARTSCDTLGAFLTDVAASLFAATGILAVLLLISAKLTVVIAGMVAAVQGVYLLAGKHHDRHGSRVAAQEAGLTAYVNNAVRRSETIFVFDCRAFILTRLHEMLVHYRHLTDVLNGSIHGYAALSTASTTLIFVVVLGLSNYFHRRGELALSDIALYFMFLQSFVTRVVQLATDLGKAWATLGRVRVLQQTLLWFDGHDTRGEHSTSTTHSCEATPSTLPPLPLPLLQADERTPDQPLVVVSDDAGSDVRLRDATFFYPALPNFLTFPDNDNSSSNTTSRSTPSVSAALKGVQGMCLTAPAGHITALYGPSGCGKSTCLRLLAGLVRPASGEVHTHRRALLLEQTHAIFLGTVAENVTLQAIAQDGTPPKQTFKYKVINKKEDDKEEEEAAQRLQARIAQALSESGCSDFLSDPYTAHIDNVDKPPFSGGQLQRICLARVLAAGGGGARGQQSSKQREETSCSLVLLDEPTTGLDAATVQQLLTTLVALRDVHGLTVLIATHDDRVAAIADHVVVLGK